MVIPELRIVDEGSSHRAYPYGRKASQDANEKEVLEQAQKTTERL